MNNTMLSAPRRATCLMGCALAFAFGLAAQTTGSIEGTVVDDANQPVAKAHVSAYRDYVAGTPPFSATAVTAADGAFRLGGLPAGKYKVCVQVPAGSLLDPCQWSDTPPSLTLSAGQDITGFKVALARGTVVTVRVNDAQKLLQTNEGKTPGSRLLIGVWTDKGLFYEARVAATDANGRDHQITVPNNRQLTLSADSAFFKLADATPGAPKGPTSASGNVTSAFQHTAADPPKSFTINVTGLAKP
jgi:hypothetical protein